MNLYFIRGAATARGKTGGDGIHYNSESGEAWAKPVNATLDQILALTLPHAANWPAIIRRGAKRFERRWNALSSTRWQKTRLRSQISAPSATKLTSAS